MVFILSFIGLIKQTNRLLDFCPWRYTTDEECEGEEQCEKGQWFATGWSDCSATKCEEEGGLKKRKVYFQMFLVSRLHLFWQWTGEYRF